MNDLAFLNNESLNNYWFYIYFHELARNSDRGLRAFALRMLLLWKTSGGIKNMELLKEQCEMWYPVGLASASHDRRRPESK